MMLIIYESLMRFGALLSANTKFTTYSYQKFFFIMFVFLSREELLVLFYFSSPVR